MKFQAFSYKNREMTSIFLLVIQFYKLKYIFVPCIKITPVYLSNNGKICQCIDYLKSSAEFSKLLAYHKFNLIDFYWHILVIINNRKYSLIKIFVLFFLRIFLGTIYYIFQLWEIVGAKTSQHSVLYYKLNLVQIFIIWRHNIDEINLFFREVSARFQKFMYTTLISV